MPGRLIETGNIVRGGILLLRCFANEAPKTAPSHSSLQDAAIGQKARARNMAHRCVKRRDLWAMFRALAFCGRRVRLL